MVGTGFSDTCDTITCSTAEISVVAFRMDYPVVPANGSKVNVERITTALT